MATMLNTPCLCPPSPPPSHPLAIKEYSRPSQDKDDSSQCSSWACTRPTTPKLTAFFFHTAALSHALKGRQARSHWKYLAARCEGAQAFHGNSLGVPLIIFSVIAAALMTSRVHLKSLARRAVFFAVSAIGAKCSSVAIFWPLPISPRSLLLPATHAAPEAPQRSPFLSLKLV